MNLSQVALALSGVFFSGVAFGSADHLFDGFRTGTLLFESNSVCVANNAIDFQNATRVGACLPENRQFGAPGKAQFSGAQGDFSRGNFVQLQNSNVTLSDVGFPGITFYPTGARLSRAPVDLLRFDVNADGRIDAGDMIYQVSAFTVSQTSDKVVSIELEGAFREILSVRNYGMPGEEIRKGSSRIPSSKAVMTAEYGKSINNLMPVGYFGQIFDPFDLSSSFADEFKGIDPIYLHSTSFSFEISVE